LIGSRAEEPTASKSTTKKRENNPRPDFVNMQRTFNAQPAFANYGAASVQRPTLNQKLKSLLRLPF
jgi:hypothetical protein